MVVLIRETIVTCAILIFNSFDHFGESKKRVCPEKTGRWPSSCNKWTLYWSWHGPSVRHRAVHSLPTIRHAWFRTRINSSRHTNERHSVRPMHVLCCAGLRLGARERHTLWLWLTDLLSPTWLYLYSLTVSHCQKKLIFRRRMVLKFTELELHLPQRPTEPCEVGVGGSKMSRRDG